MRKCVLSAITLKVIFSGTKYLGGGNCNQGLWNPNWQDMDLQSFVLKKNGGYFQVYIDILNRNHIKIKIATCEAS